MWTEIILLIAVTTIRTHARINGLQNDPGAGYTYDPPEHRLSSDIQGSLAYYINIPANQEIGNNFEFNSNPEEQFPQYTSISQQHSSRAPQQDLEVHSINQQYTQQVFSQQNTDQSHFNRYEQMPSTRNSIYNRPPAPNQYTFPNRVLPFGITASRFQPSPYQIDPRSRAQYQASGPANSFVQGTHFRAPQSNVGNNFKNSPFQDYHHPPAPNLRTLIPPQYNPHVTLQTEPKSFGSSATKQYRIVPSVASLPMSRNVQLPFPIGVVPIKFRALPLKTHIRQAELLPITSYQARDPYISR